MEYYIQNVNSNITYVKNMINYWIGYDKTELCLVPKCYTCFQNIHFDKIGTYKCNGGNCILCKVNICHQCGNKCDICHVLLCPKYVVYQYYEEVIAENNDELTDEFIIESKMKSLCKNCKLNNRVNINKID